nr:glycosyltransferase [Tamaricihabitans halophyticus]
MVRMTGLSSVEVGHDVDSDQMVRNYLVPLSGQEVPSRTGKVPRALEMFRANAGSMLDDLIGFARSWRPDVLVFEPTEWAGPIVAQALGIPAVRHLFGADLAYRARTLAAGLLAPLAEPYGVGEVNTLGSVTIDPMPASAQVDSVRARVPIRHVPFGGYGNYGGSECGSPSDRPRVCVTWGRTIGRLEPARMLGARVVRALSTLDLDVIIAVDSTQLAHLGSVGEQATVITDAPLDSIVGDCDLVVAHGGAATTLTSLAAGTPLLLIPQLPDHIGHSAAVEKVGAAAVLDAAAADQQSISQLVRKLLEDAAIRESAQRIQAEIGRQPTPAQVVADMDSWLIAG